MRPGGSLAFRRILAEKVDRAAAAKGIAECIAAERGYRWVGLYEVAAEETGMIACTGATPPTYPRFPVSRGLCGAAVATKSVVNVGDVREDSRWLETFASTRAEIIVPIYNADGRVTGLIDVESDRVNAFGAADEQYLSHCAAEISSLF